MRIHGLCLVKNEADILRQSLQAARAWCDVFDAHDGRFVLNEHLMPPIPDLRRPLLRRFVSNRFTRSIRRHLNRIHSVVP